MGLSCYGKDTEKEKIYKLFDNISHDFKLNLKYFKHIDSKFNLDFYNKNPIIGNLLEKKLKNSWSKEKSKR